MADTVRYQMIAYDIGGNFQASWTDFQELAYSKSLRYAGAFSAIFDGAHEAATLLQDKWLIEIRRRVPEFDIDWYTDFRGIYREPEIAKDGALDVLTIRGIEQRGVLGWRHVAYPADTAWRSSFTAANAETTMKGIVRYNCTTDATTGDGRIRNGPITNFPITVESDAVRGNMLSSFGCAWQNVLEALGDLAYLAGGDWDLVWTGSAGSPSWQFRFYPVKRGQDLRTNVVFAVNYDNIRNQRYSIPRLAEKTVAIVGGQGREADRLVRVRTGGNYSAANDIETFLNASSYETAAGLDTYGDQELAKMQARGLFDFEPVQSEGTAYGLHYAVDGVLGDLVRARWMGIAADYKIVGVDVAVRNAGGHVESIGLAIEGV